MYIKVKQLYLYTQLPFSRHMQTMLCKQVKGGEMATIGCDNPNCLYGLWFHLDCLKSKSPESGTVHADCRTMPQFSQKRSKQ